MIYLVEDDENIQNLIIYTLQSLGYKAKGFHCSSDLYKEIDREIPDLIFLITTLLEEDGLSILLKIRKDHNLKDIPIILLSESNNEYDIILGLESGADDYITKPFRIMELISRMKAVLRRCKPNEKRKHILEYKELVLDTKKHILKVDGKETFLTKKEFIILTTLMSNIGYVYTRESLIEQVWGLDFNGESRTIDVHMRKLRQKISPFGRYIETIRGVGYKIGDNYKI